MKNRPTRTLRMSAVIALLGATTFATARPLDAVGNCPENAVMTFAPRPFNGSAQALLNNSAFTALHAAATVQENQAIRALTWKSGLNRAFRSGTDSIVVATICNPADCEHHRDYIAFSPAKNLYGGSFYEGRHIRDYGVTETEPVYDHSLGAAITCAQNLDWQNGKAK